MTHGKESVAFFGIGTMGHAMATRALGAGIPTIVWNRDPDATGDLLDRGADVAGASTPMQRAGQTSSSRW